jgi:hypothetical protein
MRWVGHVARIREMRNTKFWSEDQKGRNYSEDLGVDRRITLELFLGRYMWTEFIWLRIETIYGLFLIQ